MSYLNANICKHLRCPYFAELKLQQDGLELCDGVRSEFKVSYQSIAPDYLVCWLKILTLVEDPRKAHPRHLLMPACMKDGFMQFEVPTDCPNAMEHSVLEPANIAASQEKRIP